MRHVAREDETFWRVRRRLASKQSRSSEDVGGVTCLSLLPNCFCMSADIAELDGGKVAKVSWPDPANLTEMVVDVTPDQGMWKGATFQFTIKVPDMYPHEPPKVLCTTKVSPGRSLGPSACSRFPHHTIPSRSFWHAWSAGRCCRLAPLTLSFDRPLPDCRFTTQTLTWKDTFA